MLEFLLVSKSDTGQYSVFDDRDNFLASFTDGCWTLGRAFQNYEMEERFDLVQNDQEALEILEEARAALNRPLEVPSDKHARSA